MAGQARNCREGEIDGVFGLNPATRMLLDATNSVDRRTWRVLGGESALTTGLANAARRVFWQPADVRERAALNSVGGEIVLEAPGTAGPESDAVAIVAPPDRDLVRWWLLIGRDCLAPGGRLYLAGANAEGIRPALADGRAIFGDPVHEAYGRKQRLAVFSQEMILPELPDWATRPGVQPGAWESFTAVLGGQTLDLVTQAGVFGGAKVDAGTRLMIDSFPGVTDATVMDVGCGVGAIGIAARLAGAARVDMVDASLLAVQAAEENIRRLGLTGCTAMTGDVFLEDKATRYDLIVSNPPFHRGKSVDFAVADRLIDEAPRRLAPGGALLLVANAFLAYDRRMRRGFRDVEIVAATRQYRVIRASDPAGTA